MKYGKYVEATTDFEYLLSRLTNKQISIIDSILEANFEDKIALNLNKNKQDEIDFDNIELTIMDDTYEEIGCELTVLKWVDDFEDTGYMCDVVSEFN